MLNTGRSPTLPRACVVVLLCTVASAYKYTENDCNSASQCHETHGPHYVCTLSGSKQRCTFKPLFPMKTLDIASSVLAAVCTLPASGGGIGGGGLLVPLYINVYSLDTSYAIPLSIATIFGGQIANLWWNGPKKHPTAKTRSLIDWDLALLWNLPLLLGLSLGCFCTRFFLFG